MKKLLLLIAVCSTFYANAQVITIAKARTHAIGDTVSVRGIISCNSEISNNQRFIQDGTDGISMYGSAISSLNEGDSVLVKGAINSYKGLLEIDPNASFTPTTYTTSNKRHAAKVIAILKGGGFDSSYEGQLVRINGVMFTKSTPGTLTVSGTGTNFYVTNGTDSAQVRIYTGVNFNGMNTPKGKVGLQGILGQYCAASPCGAGTYQLIPIDSSSDLFRSTSTSNIKNLASEVNIYPNPASSELTISLTDFSSSVIVDIYALDGKLVFENKISSATHINTSNWSNGLYLVRLTQDGVTTTLKLVISK